MHFAKFERLVSNAHATIRKKCGQDGFPEEMKIRSLLLGKTKDPESKHPINRVIQKFEDWANCAFLDTVSGLEEDAFGDTLSRTTNSQGESQRKKHQET